MNEAIIKTYPACGNCPELSVSGLDIKSLFLPKEKYGIVKTLECGSINEPVLRVKEIYFDYLEDTSEVSCNINSSKIVESAETFCDTLVEEIHEGLISIDHSEFIRKMINLAFTDYTVEKMNDDYKEIPLDEELVGNGYILYDKECLGVVGNITFDSNDNGTYSKLISFKSCSKDLSNVNLEDVTIKYYLSSKNKTAQFIFKDLILQNSKQDETLLFNQRFNFSRSRFNIYENMQNPLKNRYDFMYEDDYLEYCISKMDSVNTNSKKIFDKLFKN